MSEFIKIKLNVFVGRNLPTLREKKMLFAPESYGQRVPMEFRAIQIPGFMSESFNNNWENVDKLLLTSDEFGGQLGRNPLKIIYFKNMKYQKI